MILGKVVMGDELSGSQMEAVAATNANITTGITVVPTEVDEISEVNIHKYSEIEGKPYPKEEEVTSQNVEIKVSVAVRTIDEEYEV